MLKDSYAQGSLAALEKTAVYQKSTLDLVKKAITKAKQGDDTLLSALKKMHNDPNIRPGEAVSEASKLRFLTNDRVSKLRSDVKENRAGAFSNSYDEFSTTIIDGMKPSKPKTVFSIFNGKANYHPVSGEPNTFVRD